MIEKEFFEELSILFEGRIVLMGVGNKSRRDDVAGSLLARGLGATEIFLPIDCGDLPENFTGPVKQFSPDRIVFVDSVDFGGQAGAIAFFELDSLHKDRLRTRCSSLQHVMDLLRKETDAEISLVGIQPGDVSPGTAVTPAVQVSIEILRTAISELFDATSDRGESS